jgi:leucyl-tRNA synthetase
VIKLPGWCGFLICTQASADKIIREMEMFGPDFENYEERATDEKEKPSAPSAQVAVGKATKGKIAAKSTGLTYQFQIMESIGVPRSEIKKFADPYHWLTYFPPICIVSIFPGNFERI